MDPLPASRAGKHSPVASRPTLLGLRPLLLTLLMLVYSNLHSIAVDHGVEWSEGDHFEGHLEGQNPVSVRQPESV
jgi:hypothetical protein